jgi:hypothetical protein
MTMTDRTAAASSVLLPISEAAPRLHLHPSALRSRIRRGVIQTRHGNAGQLLVEVPANAQPAPEIAVPSPEDDLALEVAVLRRELEAARLVLVRAEGERDATNAAVKIEAAKRVIAELRTMLSEARRHWWRHVLLT